MLKDALEWVKELAQSASRARIFSTDKEPNHVYWIEDKTGELTRYEGSPGFRNHAASDLTTIVALAKEFLRIKDNTVSAWVTPQEVVLLHDDDDRRSRTTLKLQLSKQLQQLKVWENTNTYFDTSALLLKLRTMFAEPPSKDLSELALAITAAKFTRYSETDVKVDHGKSSVGKKLQQELQPSQKPIPTDILLSVPIYAGIKYGPSTTIRLAVEPNLEDQNYALIPMAGSYDTALKAGEDQLVSQLLREVGDAHEGTFVVYRGTP
jgi:hypothetical protein